MNVSSFEKKFVDKITQIVKIGPDIKPDNPLYTEAQEYVFGFVPVEEKEGGPEEMANSMIEGMIHVIRAELDANIGPMPRTPTEVEQRLQEYKKWRVRFASRPKIHKYTAKKQIYGQPWVGSTEVYNEWEEVIRMEGRWLYEKYDTLHSTKVNNG